VVPACEMLMVCPAMVIVPVRPVAEAALGEIVTPIVALPLPVVGASAAHGALLDAVHEQFEPFAETAIVPVPLPDAYGDPSVLVSTVTLQASASCVITNGCPPIVNVPLRCTVVGLGSTE